MRSLSRTIETAPAPSVSASGKNGSRSSKRANAARQRAARWSGFIGSILMDNIAEIVAGLTEAQREWLLALEPTADEQRVPVHPGANDAGVDAPDGKVWLGSNGWFLGDDFMTSRLSETGLAVRAHLNGE